MKRPAKTKEHVLIDQNEMRQQIRNRETADQDRATVDAISGECEQRMATIVNHMQMGVVVIDAQTHVITDVNRKAAEIIGEPVEQIIGKVCHKFICPSESGNCPIADLRQEIDNSERTLLRANGEVIPVLKTAISTQLNGRQYIIDSFVDISDRKQMEWMLRKERDFAESLVNTAQAIVLVLDTKGHILRINPYMEEISGYRLGEVQGKDWFTTFLPERDQARIKKIFLQAVNDIQTRGNINAIITKDGSERIIEWYDKTLKNIEGRIVGVLAIGQDITERNRAEVALRDSEEKFRNIVNASPLGIFLFELEPDGRLVFQDMNPAADTILGVDCQQFIGRTIEEAFPSLADTEIPEMCRRTAAEGISWSTEQVEYEDENIKGLYEVHAFQSSPGNVVFKFSDITERKRVEEALIRSEEKYASVVENSKDAIVIHVNGTIQFVNQAASQLLGYRMEEFLGNDMMHFVAPQYRELVGKRYTERVSGKSVPNIYEISLVKKDGSLLSVELNVTMINYEGESAALVFIRDITERKHLEAQLLQSEKMSALGQLISGVAHELNNPMTGVLGYSQLLLNSPHIREEDKQGLEKIHREADRARKIVQNLLTFARQHKPTRRICQINEIIHRTLDLRAYELNVNNIEVIRNLDPLCPPLFADEHQLQQVFMNIVINAEQAMLGEQKRGRLEVTSHWDGQREMVLITFRDDGPGIPEASLSKIFDPFFTTKPVGLGTGLGLSISYGIVQEHGGRISAANGSDGGAIFTIALPGNRSQVSDHPATSAPVRETRTIGTKRILVVDDEASVVELVRATLTAAGYQVETALSGGEALERIATGHFDAVVSDCKMPGTNGFDLYLDCTANRPELADHFLFLTGDTVSPDSVKFMEAHDVAHLSKPFQLNDLISAIDELFEPQTDIQ